MIEVLMANRANLDRWATKVARVRPVHLVTMVNKDPRAPQAHLDLRVYKVHAVSEVQ